MTTHTFRRFLRSGLAAWAVVTVFAFFFITQLRKEIKFGIDLVGGTYITLEVDVDTLVTPEMTESERARITREAVEANIAVLRNRLDQFGVGEVPIAAQGDRMIVIELPDVHNPEQARSMVRQAALLEIKPVEDAAYSKEEMLERRDGKLSKGLIFVPGKEARDGAPTQWFLVPEHAEMTGALLKSASVNPCGGKFGDPVVSFVFNAEGGAKFHALTSRMLRRRIAIILDGTVIMAPSVESPLRNEGIIEGGFTYAKAHELALLLKSGAFAAPVRFLEERHIGPSLGEESIRRGMISCALGLGLLFLFSIITYKMAGLLAFIVLIYNLLLILLGLSWFKATLTLPGIAGMVLSIGMAIDASILIYERIREELAAGHSLRKAVDVGFSGALAVIIDANVTHFLVAFVLYKLGAGPIQGFAITMIIGIIATLLTGILLLKSIFNFLIDVMGVRRISI